MLPTSVPSSGAAVHRYVASTLPRTTLQHSHAAEWSEEVFGRLVGQLILGLDDVMVISVFGLLWWSFDSFRTMTLARRFENRRL